MSSKKAIQFLKKDPLLAKVINEVGRYHLKIISNHYESLVETIITQQLAGPAAKSISNKFRKLYQSKFPKPNEVIGTRNSTLRKTGLSARKIEYIKELSRKIESKEIKLNSLRRLSDEEIILELISIKGIGRWTADMFLIFSLGRLDVLPVGDLGLKKGIQRLHSLRSLPKEDEVIQIGQKWRPFRSVATWYLWKSLQNFDNIG